MYNPHTTPLWSFLSPPFPPLIINISSLSSLCMVLNCSYDRESWTFIMKNFCIVLFDPQQKHGSFIYDCPILYIFTITITIISLMRSKVQSPSSQWTLPSDPKKVTLKIQSFHSSFQSYHDKNDYFLLHSWLILIWVFIRWCNSVSFVWKLLSLNLARGYVLI